MRVSLLVLGTYSAFASGKLGLFFQLLLTAEAEKSSETVVFVSLLELTAIGFELGLFFGLLNRDLFSQSFLYKAFMVIRPRCKLGLFFQTRL